MKIVIDLLINKNVIPATKEGQLFWPERYLLRLRYFLTFVFGLRFIHSLTRTILIFYYIIL